MSATVPEKQVLIVMGVSGSGKTTVAHVLAARLGWPFLEGDDLHPLANVEKMRSGHPLTDADRLPWLHAIAAWIDERIARGEAGIVTCSALKHAYRDILIGDRPQVRLIYLQGDRALIARHMGARTGHFMPPALLDSQFAALEEPAADEHPLVVPIGDSPEQEADAVLAALAEPAHGA
jgi:carbohydrate kinase (thermoresistant glucokinase family)